MSLTARERLITQHKTSASSSLSDILGETRENTPHVMEAYWEAEAALRRFVLVAVMEAK